MNKKMFNRKVQRKKAHRKIRMKIMGTKERPRFCVFRSNQHIYAQLVDDEKGKVLTSVSDLNLKTKKNKKTNKAKEVGKLIAQQALAEKIDSVVFDRGGFLFHGRIKAVAEGAREGGLKF